MKTRKAFTIIEFLLAISFLATMVIGIAALTIRISNIYQKGLSLRGVNANGREIVSDLTRVINGSRVNVAINPTPDGSNRVTKKLADEARAEYFIETKDSEGRQLGGAFCTGSYSYVWNTADNLRIARSNSEIKDKKYTDINIKKITGTNHVFAIKANDGYKIPKFARFIDRERAACAHNEKFEPDDSSDIKESAYLINLGTTKSLNDVVELIEDNEEDLAIYNFTVLPATQHDETKQIFYSGMFILATYRGGVNIKSNGDFCEGSTREDGGRDNSGDNEMTLYDFDYCAVNKFNFSARATGETGINKHGE